MPTFQNYAFVMLFGALLTQAQCARPTRISRNVNTCSRESNYLHVGHQATLSCLAPPGHGVQEVEAIDWKQDGTAISIDGSKYQMVANRLIINNIQPDDEGVYSCVVTDERISKTEVKIMCLYILADRSEIVPEDEGVCICVVSDKRNKQEVSYLYALAAVCLGVYFCLRACQQARSLLIPHVRVETPEYESSHGRRGTSVLVAGRMTTKNTFYRPGQRISS